MSIPASSGYYSSSSSGLASTDAPATGAGKGEPPKEEETVLNWTFWLVELQNNLSAWWHKREKEERAAFKALEDDKWKERKRETHRKTHESDGYAKAEMKAIREERLRQGLELKEKINDWDAQSADAATKWQKHGHDLTVEHGKEQAEKIKESRAESVAVKTSVADEGREEHKQRTADIDTNARQDMKQKQRVVKMLQKEKVGKVAEGKRFTNATRVSAVKEVQGMEKEWKAESTRQRDAFVP